MIALAPPATVIAKEAEAAAEMTGMETMAAAKAASMAAARSADMSAAKSAAMAAAKSAAMAAAKSAATATVAAAATATATATDQDQWAASCTHCLLLGAAEIARLCQRGSCGKGQRKSADKTRHNVTVPHDLTPLALWPSGRSPSA
jgi:hypothetical protein